MLAESQRRNWFGIRWQKTLVPCLPEGRFAKELTSCDQQLLTYQAAFNSVALLRSTSFRFR